MHDKYSGLMKVTTHLDHMSHCKTASCKNWSNRWTYRVFFINARRDEIRRGQAGSEDAFGLPEVPEGGQAQSPDGIRGQEDACCSSSGALRSAQSHPRPFVGVSQQSIFKRPSQVLAINAHKMAPRTSKRLQERAWDAPT